MAKIEVEDEVKSRGGFLFKVSALIVIIVVFFSVCFWFLKQPSGKDFLAKMSEIFGLEAESVSEFVDNLDIKDVAQNAMDNAINSVGAVIIGDSNPLEKSQEAKKAESASKAALADTFITASDAPNSASIESASLRAGELAKDDEIRRLQEALAQKEEQISQLAKTMDGLDSSVEQIKNAKNNISSKMRYTIKPKKKIIAECFSMATGRWEIPSGCLLHIATNANKAMELDKKVVAFEVQGIVDTKSYRGLSPELKQEGLASFRALAAIKEIEKKVPNAVAFEGPSIQLPEKRGYTIKAYYVE